MSPVDLIAFGLAAAVLTFPAVIFYAMRSHYKESHAKMNIEAMGATGRLQDMEDRLKVLERIVTDKGYDVAEQIETLRDARRIEAQLEASEQKGNA